jgi:hypothetical protein
MEPWQVLVLLIVVAAFTAVITWWVSRRPRDMSSSLDARLAGYSVWKWDTKATPPQWVLSHTVPKGASYNAPPPPVDPGVSHDFFVRVIYKPK